jgi:hypothetical protein
MENAMSKKLQTATFRLLDALVILTMVLAAPLNVFAAPVFVVDDAGADDEPGQKDLNFLTIDYTPSTPDIAVTWGWDDTQWSGNNTGDACTLFDTDSDGFANYSLCITVNQNGTYDTTRLYSCTADNRTDRCSGPTQITTFLSTGSASIQAIDPFGTSGRANNDCSSAVAGACLTEDTVAALTVKLSDFGGSAAKLINVCSYPSQEPNSDPSDCVIAPNAGFLTIIKVASPDDGTAFTFNASAPSASGDSSWTINGSGSVQLISYAPGTVYDLSEAIPASWRLDSVSCAIQTNPTTSTGTADATPVNGPASAGIQDFTIQSGLETICTFTDTQQPAQLTLLKTVVNDNGGAAIETDFQAYIDATAVPWGAAQSLSPGSYTASEDTLAGYTASAWGGDCAANGTITLQPGDNKTCTITNDDQQAYITVVKVVNNDHGGTAAPDDFDLTLEGNPVSSGVQVPVNPGTYTAGETLLPGYTFDGFTGDCDNNGDVTVALGESKTCTFTNNDQQAFITVIKAVTNDNGGSAAPDDFDLTLEGNPVLSGVAVPVNPGTYTAGETLLSGYTFEGFSGDCDASGDVTVALGESKTCTLTNDDQQAFITVVKVVTNDNGGNALPDDFNLTLDGNPVLSGVAVPVNPGTYTAGETLLSGYTFEGFSGDCDTNGDVTVALGESKTCTLTNDDVAPTLTLIKNVVNDNGGNAEPDDFNLTIGGNSAISGTPYTLSANTPYAINETLLSGYTFVDITGDPECPAILGGTVTLDEGENVTCTITNDDVAPTLTLIKIVVNDDGGDAVVSDFPLSIDGNPVTSGAPNTLSANVLYTASETTQPGYTASTWGGDCNPDGTITLNEGQSATCTITNNDVAPTLKLVKVVDNGDGGNAVADDWTLSADAAAPFSGRNFSNAGGSGALETVFANAGYDLSETTVAGYTAGNWSCDGGALVGSTVTLNEGETGVTCTITNNDVAPTLTLVKVVINDDGGNAQPDDFSLTIGGNAALSGVAYTLSANTPYAINETLVSGYTFVDITGDPKCPAVLDGTVTLDEGESVTCTITNDDVAPSLTLIKNVINNNGGNAGPNDFGLSIGGDAATSGVAYTLDANTPYSIDEVGLSGYTFVDITGDPECPAILGGTVTLDEGEDVTCTITNDDVAPTLTLVKVVVNDNGGNALPDDFNLTIDGNPAISGTAYIQDANTPYAIDETLLSGYTFVGITGNAECPAVLGGTVTLDEGENVTCTITNDDVAPTLTLIKNVVNDHGGNAQPDDFNLTIGGNPATSGTAYTLDANTPYAIDETLLSGYTFVDITGDPECPAVLGGTVTLDEGENVTCTITNDDQPATLIVIKHVINDNGGTATAGDFILDSGGVDDTPDDFAGEDAPGTTVTLDAGTYNVTETGPAGYSASFTADCSGSIANGETRTCTVTNDDIQPQLIVIKHVINDNGGTALAGDFTISVSGSSPSPASFPGAEAPGTSVAVNAGSYDLSETGPGGYAPSFSADCTGSIAVGETKTCTVTNDDIAPTLTVIKVLLPTSDTGKFNLQIDGLTKATNVGNNGTTGPVAVNVGAHTVSETAGTGTSLANYVTTIGGDCNADGTITLALAENKTCTITNARRGTIIVEKQTNPNAAPGSFTFTGTGAGTIADNGQIIGANLAPGTYTSTEADPSASLFALTGIACNDGSSAHPSTGDVATRTATFNLDPGETVKCTFTNSKDFHAGTIGFWKNWRNQYTSTQLQLLIDYLKTNNPLVYNEAGYPLTIQKVDAIFNVGAKTPRDQMILAQLTALKFNLAITQLDGTSGLVQKNDDICLAGMVDVSGISGATAFFGTSTPTIQQVVDEVENRWTGNLTTSRSNWKFNFSNNTQRDRIIKVLTGINEGTIVMSSGCP